MWLVVSGVLVLLLLFRRWLADPFKTRKPRGKAISTAYNLGDLILPRLGGWRLLWFSRLLDSVIGRWLVIPIALRQSNALMLRRFRMSDDPTYYPIVKPITGRCQLKFDRANSETQHPEGREPSSNDSFEFTSVTKLSEAYRSGTATPLSVVEAILSAIESSDMGPKPLRAIVQCNKDEAMRMARESTLRLKSGDALSLLDGIPVAIKEEFSVVPYHFRVGTTFLGEEPSQTDATVVRKLREAGAVVIGIANMHELGIGTTGCNSNRYHGLSRNPYNIDHYAGGSSSGSAAAVAAGLVPIAIGADGGGSIRIPASMCGVVGLKATFGRISDFGSALIASTVVHAGPLCSTVEDAAIVYDVIAGPDPEYPIGLNQPAVEECRTLSCDHLLGVKLGIDWRHFEHGNPEVVDCCSKVLGQLVKKMGAEVVAIEIPELEETRVAHITSILVEMASFMSTERTDFAHLLNPETRVNITTGGELTALDYLLSQQQRTRTITFLKDIFNSVDIMVTPTTPMTAVPIDPNASQYGESDATTTGRSLRFSFLANLSGIPAISVPAGYDSSGLPVGLQLMGCWWEERLLFRVALAAEQLVKRTKPEVYYSIM